MSLQGHFITSQKGRVFVSQFGDNKGNTAVLCLPSVGEELNLSRSVLAKQCQAYATSGTDSFIMDYYGTGDSEGEFEQSDANSWLEDILTVGGWLLAQGYKKLVLIGVRVGGLLLAAHQQRLHDELPIVAQILWKPVTSGKVFISQFMRIKQANQMLKNAQEKVNWRKEILAGNTTEIAGYLITSTFIEQLELLSITQETRWLTPLHWLELASANLTPATKRLVQDNPLVNTHVLDGPAFWQVPEIFDLPHLTSLGDQLLTSCLES